MSKRFLNIEYSGIKTDVDVTEAETFSAVQDAIKARYGHGLAHVAAPYIQLFTTNKDQHINSWNLFNSLSEEYFTEGSFYISLQVIKSFTSELDHFTVHYPSSMPDALLSPLKKLDALLNDEAIYASFPLNLQPDHLKQTLAKVPLKICFVLSKEFNDSNVALREVYGEDICCNSELGWLIPEFQQALFTSITTITRLMV
jgi:hypothetical protein